MIVLMCPGCRTRLTTEDDRAGETFPCPRCRTAITLPLPTPLVPVPEPPPFPLDDAGEPLPRCYFCGHRIDREEDIERPRIHVGNERYERVFSCTRCYN